MKSLFCAGVALAALCGASAVHAQAADWRGAYIGAQAGASNSADDSGTILFDTNLDGIAADTVRTAAGANAFSPGFCDGAARSATPGDCRDDDTGFELGVRAGYDWQFGNIVVGVLGEASHTTLNQSVSAFSTTPAFYTMERELNSLVAVRARAGVAFGQNLVYATGGYAHGEIENKFFTSNAVNTFVSRGDDSASGYQLGGGFERQLTGDVSLGLEYIYTRLEADDARVRAQGPAPATNPFILTNAAGTDFRRSEDDFNIHSVRVTAAYRF